MTIEAARRVRELPPYLFAHIDRLKSEARERGADIIDLGIGDPDLPTPEHVVEALCRAARDPATHRYPSYEGLPRFRQAAAGHYRRRFGVDLDPGREVLALIGSKEGLAHLPLALINPGDLALVPDPAYPVYATAVSFAGGRSFRYGLLPEQQFLPDLQAIPEQVAREARLLYINYPNNPTGGSATLEDLERIAAFACRHDLLVVSDLAYADIYLEGEPPPSLLQVPGSRERTIELFSLSKTYNMTGWRVAFAAGCADLVAALGKIKTNVDSGVFMAVQEAAVAALQGDQGCVEVMRRTYRRRRDLLLAGLERLGLGVEPPRATFYIFARVPAGQTSMGFASWLLQEAGVVATPGNGFGERGEGFVRFALTVDDNRLEQAVQRMGELGGAVSLP